MNILKSKKYEIVSNVKDKGSSPVIAPLTILDTALLQPWKWQLIGIDCSTVAQASGCPLPALMDFGPAVMQPVGIQRPSQQR